MVALYEGGQMAINEQLEKMQEMLSRDNSGRLPNKVFIETSSWQRRNISLSKQLSQFLAVVVDERNQDDLIEHLG